MGRVLLGRTWVPVADATALVQSLVAARTYKRDKDGKFSSGGGGGSGDASELSLDDFAEGTTYTRGAGSPEAQIVQQLRERAAAKVADRWDVSPADLEATIRESGYWDNYKDIPFGEQKRAFIEERIKEFSSGPHHPIPTLMIHGAATAAGADFQLSDSQKAVVEFARSHPAIQRATSSLGRAMHEETQAWFAERGITAVKAKRATMSSEGDESNNLRSSWSLQRESGFFQASSEHTVVEADIPVARIFSIPPTGLGSYEEAELVVMAA